MAQPNVHREIQTALATALQKWRRQHKIPLKKIAADLGVSIATVNSWERGKRYPGVRHFEKLAHYTGVPLCQLICAQAENCGPNVCWQQPSKKR